MDNLSSPLAALLPDNEKKNKESSTAFPADDGHLLRLPFCTLCLGSSFLRVVGRKKCDVDASWRRRRLACAIARARPTNSMTSDGTRVSGWPPPARAKIRKKTSDGLRVMGDRDLLRNNNNNQGLEMDPCRSGLIDCRCFLTTCSTTRAIYPVKKEW
jgi:hypothetical protein